MSIYLLDLLICVEFGAAMRFKTHEQKVNFVDLLTFRLFYENVSGILRNRGITVLNNVLSIKYNIALAIDPFFGPCNWSLLGVVCAFAFAFAYLRTARAI